VEQTFYPTLTTEQRRQDLQFFVEELVRRHRNPYHWAPRHAFEQAVGELDARLDTLQNYEFVVHLQRLGAMIGDGHTRVATAHLYHRFSFELFWFGRHLYVIGTIASYQDVLGTRVVRIGKHRIREVQGRLQAIIPQAENKWFVLQSSARQMVHVEPLATLGVLTNRSNAPWTFENDAGKQFVLEVTPVFPDAQLDWVRMQPQPLYMSKPEEGFWFTYLPEAQTVYLNFRRYDDLERNAEQFFAFLAQHETKRLVLDLRQNGGGDYTLGRNYLLYKIHSMLSLNRHGHLFVIIGRGTFSAGMTNATDFRRETEAILVGEPTGARPNAYQELYGFTLPHSGLNAYCSILHYKFQDRDTPAVMPDVRIDPDWTAFRAGRDPILEWILEQPFS
jgi:hypothetical protein